MQVILTPTAVADMFGTGLNGFQDSVPGPPTELSAEWFNSMQMEIVSVLVNQGYALDGLLFDQLDFALNNFSFDGSVAIQSGGTLSILGGGTLYLEGGSQFYADSTSSFSVNTADAEFLKDLAIGDSSGDALIVTSTSTFQSAVFFNGNVDIGNNVVDLLTVNATATFNENVTVSTATLTATQIEQTTNAGWVALGEARFYSDTSPTFGAGILQYDGRDLRLGTGVGSDVIPHHEDDWVAGDISTAAAITDTGASVTLSLLTGERCIVEMHSEMRNTNVGSTIAFRIEANGVTIGGTGNRYETAITAGTFQDVGRRVEYTAGADGSVQFKARYGANAGTTSARNIHITARRSD
jgi:hypothetical protein